MESAIATAPVMKLTVEDLNPVLGELKKYHEIYSPFFQRSEQRANAELYLKGLLSPLERKSVERIVVGVEGVDRNAVRKCHTTRECGGSVPKPPFPSGADGAANPSRRGSVTANRKRRLARLNQRK